MLYLALDTPDLRIFNMFQAIAGLFKKKPYELPAQLLYTNLVEQARQPYFYRDLGVADSVDGRFDMICLHLYLVLDRLENEPLAAQTTQYMMNYVISDVDRNFREMGVSDVGVGRKVQKLATALYGRLEAYQISGDKIESDSGVSFEKALCRNIYRSGERGDLPLTLLRQYSVQQKEFLASQKIENFLKGDISFRQCGDVA